MTSATSESETQKIYQLEREKALAARQINLAKGRQALTIKKLKQQGFEVLPVQPAQEICPTTIDLPIVEEADSNEEPLSGWILLRNIGLAALSAIITNLVVDYSYPRLRDLIIPPPADPVIEEDRDDVWQGQSIFK